MLVTASELIAHIGRYAGLDAPRPECNESESHGERDWGLGAQRKHGATQHVSYRKNHDRTVLAPEYVGDYGADEREVIRGSLEQTLPGGGARLPEVQRAG